MTLRAIEGWDGYGPDTTTITQFVRDKWTNSSVSDSRIEVDDDRFSGANVWEETTSNSYWNLEMVDAPEEVIIGAYILIRTPGASGTDQSSGNLLLGTFSGGNEGIVVRVSGRTLRVSSNNLGFGYFAGNALIDGWNLVELKCKMHDTTGYIYLYVNGVEVIGVTDIDTRYSSYTQTRARVYNYLTYNGVGGIYVCDTLGSVNNDILGPYRIQGILPDAIGDSSDWTPSDAVDNYTLVNEAPPSETGYVESGTSTDQDLYNYEPLTGTWDTIFGIQMNTRLFLDIAGSEDVAVSCLSNVTQDDETFTVTDASVSSGDEARFQRILEEDPDTASAWTTSGVGAIQGGAKFI